MRNFLKLILIGALSSIILTACGDSNSTSTRGDRDACYNLEYDTGIIGNDYCPYKGAYDQRYGYQGFAVSFSATVGVYVDFGWDYNDLCPPGETPILNNGDFSYCQRVNPAYAETDMNYYLAPNSGECAGKQWNTGATGCLPNFNL